MTDSERLNSGSNGLDCNEKEDFYFDEDGLMVMTASFHLKRGYCCGNKCRHCPYPTSGSFDG